MQQENRKIVTTTKIDRSRFGISLTLGGPSETKLHTVFLARRNNKHVSGMRCLNDPVSVLLIQVEHATMNFDGCVKRKTNVFFIKNNSLEEEQGWSFATGMSTPSCQKLSAVQLAA